MNYIFFSSLCILHVFIFICYGPVCVFNKVKPKNKSLRVMTVEEENSLRTKVPLSSCSYRPDGGVCDQMAAAKIQEKEHFRSP